MMMTHPAGFAASILLGVAVSVAPAVTRADDPEPAPSCPVEIDVEFVGEDDFGDGKKLQFEVDIETTAPCGEIEYDLVLEQRQPNDQVHRVRKTRKTRLRDGELTQRVEHVVGPGQEMLDYEIRAVSCVPCGVDAPDPLP